MQAVANAKVTLVTCDEIPGCLAQPCESAAWLEMSAEARTTPEGSNVEKAREPLLRVIKKHLSLHFMHVAACNVCYSRSFVVDVVLFVP